jgi:beta-lactamase regulating signal transducer with metallopeptidase domain
VLYARRALLLLPADFLPRFGADERALILRHEQTHVRRCDPLWSLLADVMVAPFLVSPAYLVVTVALSTRSGTGFR